MRKVLVTDASTRTGLAVIRSLGSKQIEVTAGESEHVASGFMSKYCHKRIVYPDPAQDKERFATAIKRFVSAHDFDLIISTTDITLMPLLLCKDEIERYTKVASPTLDVVLTTMDKVKTLEIAKRIKIPFPKTYLLNGSTTLEKIASEIRYPVVIKPRMSIYWRGNKAFKLKVKESNYARNSEDLKNKLAKIQMLCKEIGVPPDFLFLQEYFEGQGFGVELLFDQTEAYATFAHKRLREYPPSGGASTLCESVVQPEMLQFSTKLLEALHWQGVAMVEFKLNYNTKQLSLMEVNGRFWGSLPLSIRAGVDFPYLLYLYLMGDKGFKIPNYLVGLKQRWLLPGDLLWLYSKMAHRDHIVSSLRQFLSSFSAKGDVLLDKDPSPVVGAMISSLGSFSDLVRRRRTIEGEIIA